jgi:hypothetical protein
MTRHRIPHSAVMAFASLGLITAAVRADAQERVRFRAESQLTGRLVQPPPGRCVDEPGHPPVVGLLEVVGAGETTLLGPVLVRQSHCVRADNSAFAGRFTLTDPRGRSVTGRYFARLVPTFNSKLPPPAPGGPWLILGNVCISGGLGGRIRNECAVKHYEPARGITNLTTGDATVFLDQTIRIDRQ